MDIVVQEGVSTPFRRLTYMSGLGDVGDADVDDEQMLR
jgi:hypothetical protein